MIKNKVLSEKKAYQHLSIATPYDQSRKSELQQYVRTILGTYEH